MSFADVSSLLSSVGSTGNMLQHEGQDHKVDMVMTTPDTGGSAEMGEHKEVGQKESGP